MNLRARDRQECYESEGERWTQRNDTITYTVQRGDTLWSIAAQFDLDVDTLRYSNPAIMRNPDVLTINQELRILPFVGAIHKVAAGDTLESIAKKWNVAPDVIIGYGPNRIGYGQITIGQEIIIPGGYLTLNIAPPARSPSTTLAWPLKGWLTSRFTSSHRAVDVATAYGATVYAAAAGIVQSAGWLYTGYGYSVVLDHGDGIQSLYSHLKGPLVRTGQRVKRGQPLGAVGSTGRSTGPHVHFEVRQNGIAVDPLKYLPSLPPH